MEQVQKEVVIEDKESVYSKCLEGKELMMNIAETKGSVSPALGAAAAIYAASTQFYVPWFVWSFWKGRCFCFCWFCGVFGFGDL